MTTVKAAEKYITVNGVRLHYLDWGTSGKPLLVCLHNHGGQAHIWDEFAEFMSSRYHVLALDQRGHGDSQWAESGYERERFVEDLAAFMDALSIQKAVLVGSSIGGWNCLLYAHEHPERVECVILVDIAPEASPEFVAQWGTRPARPDQFPSLDAAVELARQGNPWASDARLRSDTQDKLRQRGDGTWVWKADPQLSTMRLRDIDNAELIQRYWTAVEELPCPIVEVRGTGSILVSDDTIRRMEQVGKQFTAVDVEAAHVVTVDNPQGFIEATRTFLDVTS